MSDVSVNWFDIPVTNMEKAAAFYGAVFQGDLAEMQSPTGSIRAFQNGGMPVGALVQDPDRKPKESGVHIYLDGQGDIDGMLKRVEAAGGRVAMPKMAIGEYGSIAHFVDPDGNLIGLHSM